MKIIIIKNPKTNPNTVLICLNKSVGRKEILKKIITRTAKASVKRSKTTEEELIRGLTLNSFWRKKHLMNSPDFPGVTVKAKEDSHILKSWKKGKL